MPARVFRYVVKNSVPDHRLDLIQAHLCWGDWTPGGWEPPASIASGASGGMQAESGTILSGTEGWAKYRVVRQSDGAARAVLYLYWNNPYFGVTTPGFVLAGKDVTPECDADEAAPASGESVFSSATIAGDNAPPSDIRLMVTDLRRNGAPTTTDDISELYRIPLAPIWIFGTAGIWERMEVDLELVSVSTPTPQFPSSTGKRTRKLMEQPTYADWSGRWSDGVVTVDISRAPSVPYPGVKVVPSLSRETRVQVVIDDRTPGWQRKFTATCTLGSKSAVDLLAGTESVARARELWDGIVDAVVDADTSGAKPEIAAKASVATFAVKQAVAQVERAQPNGKRYGARAYAKALREKALAAGVEPSGVLDMVTAAAAELVRQPGRLLPAPDTALQLYQEIENGDVRGVGMRYQRTAPDGRMIANRYLTFDLGIR